MENQRISEDELAQKLANSRKIMRKVETGDYQKGNINEDIIKSDPEKLMSEETPVRQSKTMGLPVGVPSVDKIRRSKLPDAIKTAMIESPIPVPDISLTDSLDMNLINKAKKLMEEDNGSNKKSNFTPTNPQDKKQMREQRESLSSSVDRGELEQIIENVIRRVLDEKLTQILNAKEAVAINENLVIKVGDSLFSGRITKVKNTK